MPQPLLQLDNITRQFPAGEQTVTVLKDIHLTIHSGEMVAIVGASGSGKSTLMNILGCLDKPSSGTYRIAGRATNQLAPDDLAELRREHFGFIFQRYHLLGDLTAASNVEVPAIYAGTERQKRKERAIALLTRLGLEERTSYRPSQLSGGQQQRVSIARALMNGGQIILADEPTGALDKHSGQEVLKILKDLHQQGHTVVIVTHDMQIAEHAERIIEISDGSIIADRVNHQQQNVTTAKRDSSSHSTKTNNGWLALRDRFVDAFKMALLAMFSQRLRTFLTMLGIIIGIASVVSVVALGEGSRQKILADISSMGTSTLEVFPGSDFGDQKAGSIHTLRASDADALSQQSYVHSVTPSISTSTIFRVNNQSVSGTVNGVGQQFFDVRGYKMELGMSFNQSSVDSLAQDVVIDANTREKLFGKNSNPLGQVILLGNLPARIIGVAKEQQGGFGSSESLNVWLPYTTVMNRMLGQSYLRSITVRIKDNIDMDVAEQGVTKLLTQRHGTQDFFIFNTDNIRQTIEKTTATMTLLVSMIAVISLIVGGIGVMNIMLVSVTERTREIGVRMAVGARSSDIMQQFLIEAILVCLLGGTLGVGLALGIGAIFDSLVSSFSMIYSITSIVAAFICSTLIGVIFGFFPARRAAQMDPIHALERE
ncbi:MacB family efflux pump subunit [Pragia fontium]|uniref:Pyoverdine export ATP-binding/permease protein PvdT n=1 Tax=Pragia fontium DSM 5563 = ATCC 49100 TaxID=1122977 RepID=A0AAJ5BHN6_9GAMM|nr:MacB family efflux pump subunit [Pragia fontium]SFD04666.1 macrolide transport system ATP-binding/permease protein [Pragia fontium DSM 5563 = ATCC 49100]